MGECVCCVLECAGVCVVCECVRGVSCILCVCVRVCAVWQMFIILLCERGSVGMSTRV